MEWNCSFLRRVSTHRCIRKKGTMYVHLKRKIEMKYVCVGLLVALLLEIRGTVVSFNNCSPTKRRTTGQTKEPVFRLSSCPSFRRGTII